MDEFTTKILMLGGMVSLRIGIPLTITFGVAYWLRRLDEKWRREAAAYQATELAKKEIVGRSAMSTLGPPQKPCWLCKQCPAEARKSCPAFLNARWPCWMARYLASGRLPARCYACELFVPRRRQLSKTGGSA